MILATFFVLAGIATLAWSITIGKTINYQVSIDSMVWGFCFVFLGIGFAIYSSVKR
jgi:hypothetical protein